MSAVLTVIALISGAAEAGSWRLAAAYDLAALQTIAADPARQSAMAWRPAPGLESACGPAKAPDGLGVMEAVAVSAGMTPTLAIVLETDGDSSRREDVQIALAEPGTGELRRVLLQPMVEPRALALRVEADAALPDRERTLQLVRTQLAMELCMEHKVGRAWLGADRDSLRQAFLLSRPDGGRADRKFMGGERAPVPALRGPPDACTRDADALPARSAGDAERPGGKGAGSLELVPADVWGARLRPCDPGEEPGAPAATAADRLPLSLGPVASVDRPSEAGVVADAWSGRWQGLDVRLYAGPLGDTRFDVVLDGETIVSGEELGAGGAPGRPEPTGGEAAAGAAGLADVLARVPYALPRTGPEGRHVVALIPAWQLDEALGRLARGEPDAPLARVEPGRRNAVAWVLAHPEWLRVQVPAERAEGGDWLDLASALGGSGISWRGWGYPVGLQAGRSPVVGTMPEAPTWAQARAAQRAPQQAAFVAALGVLALFGLPGLLRVADLWTPTPTERAAYWPGRGAAARGVDPGAPQTTIAEEP